jgi:hypothetical protein
VNHLLQRLQIQASGFSYGNALEHCQHANADKDLIDNFSPLCLPRPINPTFRIMLCSTLSKEDCNAEQRLTPLAKPAAISPVSTI